MWPLGRSSGCLHTRKRDRVDTTALANGIANINMIPFDIDFLSISDHSAQSTIAKYSTSKWEIGVAVYEDNEQFDTFVDVSWPVGEGPGAKTLVNGDPWNACAIVLPGLLEILNVAGPGNGSCVDVIGKPCFESLVSLAWARYSNALGSVRNPTEETLEKACRFASQLPLVSECLGKQTDDVVPIRGYGKSNPQNGRPFVFGVDKPTDSSSMSKTKAFSVAASRVWPVVIIEAQGNYSAQASFSCPSASRPPSGRQELVPSKDGTCGGSLKYKCTDTKYFYGNCCGTDGICDYSDEVCSIELGCQPLYGMCNSVVTVTKTPTTTTTVPPNGIQTPQPTQPGMVANCNKFHYIWTGNACWQITSYNGISQEQFIKWNPKIGEDCAGMVFEAYACVGVLPITTATPTPTAPPNSVQTPQPTQPGMVKNCNKFHYIWTGNACWQITSHNGISQEQFAKWNPEVGEQCTGLRFEAYACVGVLPETTPTPTSTTPPNTIQTPQPTQPGMVRNCTKFHYIWTGNWCGQITSYNGISQEDFAKWNPQIGQDCKGLVYEAYACVAVDTRS
ncbi:hypothetical protein NLG97_g4635 [Lecanicillium saksenae]|uniref:Uncharacterized protein n=1 Tax=Lecanicillium saksenae TaxID=468837 RepID=A0ACC1QXB2_9HYPO|nr:hypothetical protein NLG97_g4635 [Lecanicillium saksenae]